MELLNHYPNAREVIWVQEEPRNMGAWRYIRGHLLGSISPHQKLDYVGRPHAAPHRDHIFRKAGRCQPGNRLVDETS